LLKRFSTLTAIFAVLLIPSVLFAADQFAPGAAKVDDNTVTVPLGITNQDDLMAIDIALQFSEGVTLKEVTFEGSRAQYFDLKIANINNEDNTVIIGMVTQTSSTPVPLLEAGEGTVANLVFEVDDPSVSGITLTAITTENPRHKLTFVYNRMEDRQGLRQIRTEPDFDSYTVALSGAVAGSDIPTEFSLSQNYPNPFNPTTEVSFGLPVASNVNLRVFNILGQEVVTLIDGQMPAGNHTVTWDGRNSSGGTVSSGVYFYRLETEQFNQTRKMLMLK
jgi:hypothetical protein